MSNTFRNHGSPVCLVGNRGDADSFSSFIVPKAPNSKDFTIHQVCLSPEVQESRNHRRAVNSDGKFIQFLHKQMYCS